MPELPDITAYLTALTPRVVGQRLEELRIASPLLLRTAVPPIQSIEGKVVQSLRRVGKRIVFVFNPEASAEANIDEIKDPLFLVLHLMIAGRLHWRDVISGARPKLGGRNNLASFDFPNGSLVLTEAGAKRRASLHLVHGEAALAALDPGGLDIFSLSPEAFRAALSAENHTLKRALTDPRVLSGIGNAYSDEILWAAQLSPLAQTQKLNADEWQRLYTATRDTLQIWIGRFNAEAAKKFPEKVTAFRPEMAVHGRYNLPCPRCGTPVQRIRYADNETNYCPTCQTSGRVLADRSLSRLLGSDWPRTLDELEALKRK
ncbi:MAG TPA: DNA-formamidopyrimidine glycosylase family protein [Acidobacteriaceae bacterium]|nr:DNA-formamidopyrimidine glycosylase family protein [Acidobacteriaceae bacterium]